MEYAYAEDTSLDIARYSAKEASKLTNRCETIESIEELMYLAETVLCIKGSRDWETILDKIYFEAGNVARNQFDKQRGEEIFLSICVKIGNQHVHLIQVVLVFVAVNADFLTEKRHFRPDRKSCEDHTLGKNGISPENQEHAGNEYCPKHH